MDFKKELQEIRGQIRDVKVRLAFTAESMEQEDLDTLSLDEALAALDDAIDILTETLEEEAFAGTAANYVVINDGCTKIASGAFRDSKVWEITIPESVTNIEEGIFSVPGVLIITPADSPADTWAKDHNYPTCVPQ